MIHEISLYTSLGGENVGDLGYIICYMLDAITDIQSTDVAL